MDQTRICFILHGQRCPRDLPNRLLRAFAPDFQVDIHITTSSLGASEIAWHAVEQGCTYLVAVGGDGTINEMVNGVMRAPAAQRQRVTLGVLPYGTGNDFVRSLGIDGSLAGLEQMIQRHQTRSLDLGVLHYLDAQGTPQVHYFANIASLGISARVVERVKRLPRWLPAGWAYGWGTLSVLLRARPWRMTLVQDDLPAESVSLIQLCLANGRYFGGGLGIAPQARADDGLLHVVRLGGATAWSFLRFLPALHQARVIEDARLEVSCCRRIEIRPQSDDCALEADGELIGKGPVTIEIVPGPLRWLGVSEDQSVG